MINTNYTNTSPVAANQAVDFRHKQYNLQAEKDFSKYEPPVVDSRFEALKGVSNDLKQAADNITKDFPPLFEQLAASISNSGVVEVTELNPYSYEPEEEPTDVAVYNTATPQTNVGNEMSADDSSFKQGSNSFAINNNDGSSYRFNVNVEENESDISVQSKVAGVINSQDIGINVDLIYDGNTDKSSLILTSEAEGKQAGFKLTDLNDSGLVSISGLDNVAGNASDAVYSVSGDIRTSSSNDVYLENGINARLIGRGSTEINIGPDTSTITNSLNKFADAYNNLNDISSDFNIGDKFDEIYNVNEEKLMNAGISKDSEGKLTVYEDKLEEAIDSNTASSNITPFVKQVGEAAEDIEYRTYVQSEENLLELATRTGLEFQNAM